jgi:hypothetical protein
VQELHPLAQRIKKVMPAKRRPVAQALRDSGVDRPLLLGDRRSVAGDAQRRALVTQTAGFAFAASRQAWRPSLSPRSSSRSSDDIAGRAILEKRLEKAVSAVWLITLSHAMWGRVACRPNAAMRPRQARCRAGEQLAPVEFVDPLPKMPFNGVMVLPGIYSSCHQKLCLFGGVVGQRAWAFAQR